MSFHSRSTQISNKNGMEYHSHTLLELFKAFKGDFELVRSGERCGIVHHPNTKERDHRHLDYKEYCRPSANRMGEKSGLVVSRESKSTPTQYYVMRIAKCTVRGRTRTRWFASTGFTNSARDGSPSLCQA